MGKEKTYMKKPRAVIAVTALFAFCILGLGVRRAHSQDKTDTSQVHMVITDQAFNDSTEIPRLKAEDLQLKVGGDDVKVAQLIPAQGDNAALQLFVLIDDTCEPQPIGNNLNDLREFINAQPATTMVGIAYMSNATIQVAQNLTNDHALAAKAIRLPRGMASAMDSPYLSLVSLVRSWPESKVRRQVLIITDGIDRLRGDTSRFGPSQRSTRPLTPPQANPLVTMPTIPQDATTASNASQRAGIIVHSIFATGVGRLGRNSWEAQLGQGGVAKVADETGGEYFSLGIENAVSFKPYLERLQKILNNQYFLVFHVTPEGNGRLQRVRISTEVPNADIAAADNVWVPGTGS
jgi:hypothetical protein